MIYAAKNPKMKITMREWLQSLSCCVYIVSWCDSILMPARWRRLDRASSTRFHWSRSYDLGEILCNFQSFIVTVWQPPRTESSLRFAFHWQQIHHHVTGLYFILYDRYDSSILTITQMLNCSQWLDHFSHLILCVSTNALITPPVFPVTDWLDMTLTWQFTEPCPVFSPLLALSDHLPVPSSPVFSRSLSGLSGHSLHVVAASLHWYVLCESVLLIFIFDLFLTIPIKGRLIMHMRVWLVHNA